MKKHPLAVVAVLSLLPAFWGGPASGADPGFDPGKGVAAVASPGSVTTHSSARVTGYTRVISPDFTGGSGGQTFGTVACPKNMVAVGGGAGITGTSPLQTINSSTPIADGSGWRVYVNNASTTDTVEFRVYVTCVASIARYAVVSGPDADNPAGTTSPASVACPGGTVPLGGGGYATSGAPTIDLATSTFTARGWRITVDNDSAGADAVRAYVICGQRPPVYALVTSRPSSVAPGSQGDTSVRCPSGTFTFGGGSFSPPADDVSLNTTLPVANADWVVYLNNNNATTSTPLRVTSVCAPASS